MSDSKLLLVFLIAAEVHRLPGHSRTRQVPTRAFKAGLAEPATGADAAPLADGCSACSRSRGEPTRLKSHTKSIWTYADKVKKSWD